MKVKNGEKERETIANSRQRGEERRLVEGDGGAQQGVDDVGVVVELLVHHEGKDAHLGGTAVVELDGEESARDALFSCF